MALKFNKMWEILTNNDFKEEELTKEVICTVCLRIMVNPFIAHCGCHYCCNCIKNLINEGCQFCPGKKEECSEEQLEFERNVVKDFSKSRIISCLTVTCPNNDCYFKTTLLYMEEHLQNCKMNTVNCPYKTVGCPDFKIKDNDLINHLNLEMVPHAQILVEAINHIRNDVKELRIILKHKEVEINLLKEEKEINKIEIKELKIEKNRSKKETVVLKKEIGKCIELIKISQNGNERFNNNRNSFSVMNQKETASEIANTSQSISFENSYMLSFDKNMDIPNDRKIKEEMISNIKFNFLWRINDFTKILKSKVLNISDFFYKYNYKLCLRTNIKGILIGEYLQIFAVIMKGDYDEEIQWPMQLTISIGIINQNSKKIHRYWHSNYNSYTDKFVFNKPSTSMNKDIYCGWIYLTDIRNIKGLLLEDSILIECSVKD